MPDPNPDHVASDLAANKRELIKRLDAEKRQDVVTDDEQLKSMSEPATFVELDDIGADGEGDDADR